MKKPVSYTLSYSRFFHGVISQMASNSISALKNLHENFQDKFTKLIIHIAAITYNQVHYFRINHLTGEF